MELRHLRYFLAVADLLNFSRAAERLRIAQPALSRQIKSLEEELSVQLFKRSTTQVELTEAGRYFRQQAEKLLVQLDIAITGAQQIAKSGPSKLNVGTDWNVPSPPITAASRALRDSHPEISVNFVELLGHRHIEALRARRIDIGFVPPEFVASREDLEFSLLYSSPIVVALPQAHPLAKESAIPLRNLKNELWLSPRDDWFPGFRAMLTQITRPAQFTPKFGRVAESFRGLLALVSAGEGIGLIPASFKLHELDGIKFVETDCEPFELFAVWLQSAANPLIPAFLKILHSEMDKTAQSR